MQPIINYHNHHHFQSYSRFNTTGSSKKYNTGINYITHHSEVVEFNRVLGYLPELHTEKLHTWSQPKMQRDIIDKNKNKVQTLNYHQL